MGQSSLEPDGAGPNQDTAWSTSTALNTASCARQPRVPAAGRKARLAALAALPANVERIGRGARKAWQVLRAEGFVRLAHRSWRRLLRSRFGSYVQASLRIRAFGGLDSSSWTHVPTRLSAEEREQMVRDIESFALRPTISIVVPVYDTPRQALASLVASVRAQVYDQWELCLVDDRSTAAHVSAMLDEARSADTRIRVHTRWRNGNISAATNDGIRVAGGEFIAFVDHDDELTEDALFVMVKALNDQPEADVLYSDSDKITDEGRIFEPFFKPDWSPEYFRHVMYVGHLLMVRRSLLRQAGGCDSRFDGVQDFELMLRLSERTRWIVHVPKIVYHWRSLPNSLAASASAKPHIDRLQAQAVQEHLVRLKLEATAVPRGTSHRVQIVPKPRAQWPLVSIMIPTKDRPDCIGPCLDSLFGKTTYREFEVVVGDNETRDVAALAAMSKHPIRRVALPGPFHFAAFNNRMAKAARGEYLVLLNNDTEIVAGDWLERLIYYASQSDVGAVGPLLLYPDGTVQHGGVILGPRGTADHLMRGFKADADGYAGSLQAAREVSAVTGACLVVHRAKYEACGGLNERFRRHYEDIDFCLRLRARGLRNIYHGGVRVVHHESKTRGSLYDYTDRVLLLDYWEDCIRQGDPFYNRNFDRERFDYALAPAA